MHVIHILINFKILVCFRYKYEADETETKIKPRAIADIPIVASPIVVSICQTICQRNFMSMICSLSSMYLRTANLDFPPYLSFLLISYKCTLRYFNDRDRKL